MSTLSILLLVIACRVFLFKNQPGVLSCGLFGGSFNRAIDESMIAKLKVLGMFNQSRGEHSCGVYNGNVLVKGVDKNKKFIDFAINIGIQPNDGTNNVFIGHTRYATMGQHTEANAHPFSINDRMIFAHNGKIENIAQLCAANGLRWMDFDVDSQAFGALLNKCGHRILNDYKGYAAVLAHRISEPGKLYVFHGASKSYANGAVTEERPLFFMKTQEGIYFSSLEDSLSFIRQAGDDKPHVLKYNVLFSVKDGEFEKVTRKIDREERNVYVYVAPAAAQPVTPPKTATTQPAPAPSVSNSTARVGQSWQAAEVVGQDFEKETMPEAAKSAQNKSIYYWKNRYWMPDGNMCEGVVVVIDKTGEVVNKFVSDTTEKTKALYFYRGVMLQTKKAFDFINKSLEDKRDGLGKYLTDKGYNFALYLSKYARYPVTNIGAESVEVKDYRDTVWKNGKIVGSESVTPMYSNRDYHFREGKLIRIAATPGRGGDLNEKFFLADKATKTSSNNNGVTAPAKTTDPSSTAPCGRKAGFATLFSIGSKDGTERSKCDAASNGRSVSRSAFSRNNNSNADCVGVDSLQLELESVKESFTKVFECIEDAELEFTDLNSIALTLYIQSICEVVLLVDNPAGNLIENMKRDIFQQAVAQQVTIEEVLDPSVDDIDFYIAQALKQQYEDDKLEQGVLELPDVSPSKIVPLADDPGFKSLLNEIDRQTGGKEQAIGDWVDDEIALNLKDEERRLIKQHEQQIQDMEAFTEIKKIIERIDDISRHEVGKLNLLEDSPVAEKAAARVLYYSDQMKEALLEIAKENNNSEMALYIKQSMSSHTQAGV